MTVTPASAGMTAIGYVESDRTLGNGMTVTAVVNPLFDESGAFSAQAQVRATERSPYTISSPHLL